MLNPISLCVSFIFQVKGPYRYCMTIPKKKNYNIYHNEKISIAIFIKAQILGNAYKTHMHPIIYIQRYPS
jgi:hypothetical protein